MWRKRAYETLITAPPVGEEPFSLAGSPLALRFVATRDEVKASGGAEAPRPKRMAFAAAYYEDRMQAIRRRVPSAETATNDPRAPEDPRANRAHLLALAKGLSETFPVATESVAKELADATSKGRDGLVQLELAYPPEALGPRQRLRMLYEVLSSIEKGREAMSEDARAKADALEASLVDQIAPLLVAMKVPPAMQERFRATRVRGERLQFLRRWVGR
jgi:hypothetical protein